MEYRFPRWTAYIFLGLIVLVIAVGVYAIHASTASPRIGPGVVFGIVGACLLALLTWGCLYVRRYSIQMGAEGVIIAGAFRTRTIPFSEIKQVVTASAPRSGTDSWLVDGSDAAIAKIDGGLVGYDSLLISLGRALESRQVLFFRRETFGSWEMQVAGDSHWVPYEAPQFARRNGRRQMYATVFACLLIAIVVALTKC